MLTEQEIAKVRDLAANNRLTEAQTQALLVQANQRAVRRAAPENVEEAKAAIANPESSGVLNNSLPTRLLRAGGEGALDALSRLDGLFRTGLETARTGDVGRGLNRIVLEEPASGNDVLEAFGARDQIDNDGGIGTVRNVASEVLLSPSNFVAGAGLFNKIKPIRQAIAASPTATKIANNIQKGATIVDEGTNLIGAAARGLTTLPGQLLQRLGVVENGSVLNRASNSLVNTALKEADDAARFKKASDIQGTTELVKNKKFTDFVKNRDILNKATKLGETSLDSVNVAVQNEIAKIGQQRSTILNAAEQFGGKISGGDIVRNIRKQAEKVVEGGKLDRGATLKQVNELTNQIIKKDLGSNFSNQNVNKVLQDFNKKFTTNTNSANKGAEDIVRKGLRSTTLEAVDIASKRAGTPQAQKAAKEFKESGNIIKDTLGGLQANIRKANKVNGRQGVTQVDGALGVANPAAVVGKNTARLLNNPNTQLRIARGITNAQQRGLFAAPRQLTNTFDGNSSSFLSSNLDRFIRNLLEEADPNNNN